MSDSTPIARFQLLFRGISDASPKTVQKIKAAFVADLELPISEIQQIMSAPPSLVMSSEAKEDLNRFHKILSACGADVEIVDIKEPKEGNEAGEDDVAFEIEIGVNSIDDSGEIKEPQKVFKVDMETEPSAEEALKGILGEMGEEPAKESQITPVKEPAEETSQEPEEMDKPLFSFDEGSKKKALQEEKPAESLFDEKILASNVETENKATELTLGFEEPPDKIEKASVEAIKKTPEVPPRKAPSLPPKDAESSEFTFEIAPEPELKHETTQVKASPPPAKEDIEAPPHPPKEPTLEDDLIIKMDEDLAEVAPPPKPSAVTSAPPIPEQPPVALPLEENKPLKKVEPERPVAHNEPESISVPEEEYTELPPSPAKPRGARRIPLDTVAVVLVLGLILWGANWYYFTSATGGSPTAPVDVESAVDELEKRASELETSKAIQAALEAGSTLFGKNENQLRSFEIRLSLREGKPHTASITISFPQPSELTNEQIVQGYVPPPALLKIESRNLPVSEEAGNLKISGSGLAYIEYKQIKSRMSGELAVDAVKTGPNEYDIALSAKTAGDTPLPGSIDRVFEKPDGTFGFFFEDKFNIQFVSESRPVS